MKITTKAEALDFVDSHWIIQERGVPVPERLVDTMLSQAFLLKDVLFFLKDKAVGIRPWEYFDLREAFSLKEEEFPHIEEYKNTIAKMVVGFLRTEALLSLDRWEAQERKDKFDREAREFPNCCWYLIRTIEGQIGYYERGNPLLYYLYEEPIERTMKEVFWNLERIMKDQIPKLWSIIPRAMEQLVV